jgi:5,10-methenyltetrahydrofolate synthetase
LLGAREAWFNGPQREAAAAALARHLAKVLLRLEPSSLGVYWPMRCEFNPALLQPVDGTAGETPLSSPLALPFCRREPREMHYRVWDGHTPRTLDECRIPASDGAALVPDVVLAPCVAYTRSGYRLGYGGGYFDRWLAAHPGATAIGVAWSCGEIDEAELAPEAHDMPLTLVVSEQGVIG